MKKFISVLLSVTVLGLLCSCRSGNGSPETTAGSVSNTSETESSAMELVEGMTENTGDENSDKPVVSQNGVRCFYGKNTGTDKTYTGLEPLLPNDFSGADKDGKKDLPTKSLSYGFGVAKDEKPHTISIENQKFFDEKGYDAISYNSKTDEKTLYLTFDCGYENGYTSKILDVLKEKKVSAAFFCTLHEVKSNPELIARMINEGHIIGNHSVNHPDFSSISRSEMFNEIKGFDDYMREKFGYSSLYFRYPQGKYNEDSLYFINSMGYKVVFWSLAYEDWDVNAQKGAANAINTVTARLHPGSVILLHSVSADNAEGLGAIIDYARNNGYEFASLEDIKA